MLLNRRLSKPLQRDARRTITRISAIVLLTILAGCASSSASRPMKDTTMITRDQILKGNYSTAYDVVRGLHPNWLVKRGTSSANRNVAIITYVDGVSYGDVTWLRNVQGSIVESIQRIDAGTATTRWGTGHSEGVIYVVTTKRSPGRSSTENR